MIGLDFETYSAVDLRQHGLFRYIADPTFRPLIASVIYPDGAEKRLDFVSDLKQAQQELQVLTAGQVICAHNAFFEQMVLAWLEIPIPSSRFRDSAVVARAVGAGSHLAAAAPQLLGMDKMEEGLELIRLFCSPSKKQRESGDVGFDPQLVIDHPNEWALFKEYCSVDAKCGLLIVIEYQAGLCQDEFTFAAITQDMNAAGWKVDLALVYEMQRRYQANMDQALKNFRRDCNAPDLNLNSLQQMKKFCADRGIKANSFAEKPLARLRDRLVAKVATMEDDDPKMKPFSEVLMLLTTKQILGGSSLKKLQTIIDTATPVDNGHYRLFDQYLHCGAGQTLRTTGRGVQMQNLKRLSIVEDMAELEDESIEWSNEKLAANLRQVFTATDPKGALIVGDFSSVESRGLAWLAGEQWKLDSYRNGLDLYKVLAEKIFSVPYANITKDQRQIGKVGELSCGYGAGAGAVQAFAENMGLHLEEAEAAKLVWDWRDANPQIVKFWTVLDNMLHDVMNDKITRQETMPLSDGYFVRLTAEKSPDSVVSVFGNAKTLVLEVLYPSSQVVMRRFFHGCYEHGRNICYYRADDRKTGDLWKPTFVDPKTKQTRRYEIYGGKLAGILTQSLCRELFFKALVRTRNWVDQHSSQMQLVGQFHDEIVVDWQPGSVTLGAAKEKLEELMSERAQLPSFPMAAEVKSDYRYTK